MQIQINGPRIYFEIPIGNWTTIPITDTVISSFVVMVTLCILCIVLGRNLTKRPNGRQVLVEKVVDML